MRPVLSFSLIILRVEPRASSPLSWSGHRDVHALPCRVGVYHGVPREVYIPGCTYWVVYTRVYLLGCTIPTRCLRVYYTHQGASGCPLYHCWYLRVPIYHLWYLRVCYTQGIPLRVCYTQGILLRVCTMHHWYLRVCTMHHWYLRVCYTYGCTSGCAIPMGVPQGVSSLPPLLPQGVSSLPPLVPQGVLYPGFSLGCAIPRVLLRVLLPVVHLRGLLAVCTSECSPCAEGEG